MIITQTATEWQYIYFESIPDGTMKQIELKTENSTLGVRPGSVVYLLLFLLPGDSFFKIQMLSFSWSLL